MQTLHKCICTGVHEADRVGQGLQAVVNYLTRELGTAQVLWNSSESSYRLSHRSSLTSMVFTTECIFMLFTVYYRLVETELKVRLL